MCGIDRSQPKHQKEESLIDEIFETITTLELDMNACKKGGRIFQQLKKAGKTIQVTDCVIAALLINQGVDSIITKNRKHFERIPGLKVISY